MRTPAGKECKHYYEDFNRHTKDVQECRLAKENPKSEKWIHSDCSRCTVPDILIANASPDMQLTLTIQSRFLGISRVNKVEATCLKHNDPIADPFVGCAQPGHHPGLDIFRNALDDLDENSEDAS